MTDKLEDLARQLGAGAADRLDVERVARGVVERLREQPVTRPWWRQPVWLRAAAVVAVVIGAAVVARRPRTPPPTPAAADSVAVAMADSAELFEAQPSAVNAGVEDL